jgi:hypothetical protein
MGHTTTPRIPGRPQPATAAIAVTVRHAWRRHRMAADAQRDAVVALTVRAATTLPAIHVLTGTTPIGELCRRTSGGTP